MTEDMNRDQFIPTRPDFIPERVDSHDVRKIIRSLVDKIEFEKAISSRMEGLNPRLVAMEFMAAEAREYFTFLRRVEGKEAPTMLGFTLDERIATQDGLEGYVAGFLPTFDPMLVMINLDNGVSRCNHPNTLRKIAE